MIRPMKVKPDWLCAIFAILIIRNITGLAHLRKHHITTLQTSIWISYRVKQRRVLAQTYQQCSLSYSQVLGLFIKIGIGSRLDSYGVMEEIKIIKIQGYYLFLGIVTLKFDGNHPLYRLLHKTLGGRMSHLGIELFSQLLCNGRASASTFTPEQSTLDDGTAKSNKVNTRMIIEAGIFSSNQRLDQVGRQIIIRHGNTIFPVEAPRAKHLAVRRIDLRGKSINRILQLVNGRHIPYPSIPNCRKHHCHGQYRTAQKSP